jgi:hypothetical protein
MPYPAAVDTRVLQQNTGRQAAVLNIVRRARAALGDSLFAAMNNGPAWNRLVREVAEVVRIMPLWKLQTVGREHLDFLYANTGAGHTITLRPGVGRHEQRSRLDTTSCSRIAGATARNATGFRPAIIWPRGRNGTGSSVQRLQPNWSDAVLSPNWRPRTA